MNKTYLTKQGWENAQSELKYLVRVRRPEVTNLLKEAGITRNIDRTAEYAYLKEEQALVEKQIAELEQLLKEAEVIRDVDTDKVSVGTRIKLKFLGDNKVQNYAIVGTHEANPFENKVSNESPLVKAILGKRVNDTATMEMGPNVFKIRILSISAQ